MFKTKWTQQPRLYIIIIIRDVAVVSAFGLNINTCLIVIEVIQYLLLFFWLNFVLDLNSIFLCFKPITRIPCPQNKEDQINGMKRMNRNRMNGNSMK